MLDGCQPTYKKFHIFKNLPGPEKVLGSMNLRQFIKIWHLVSLVSTIWQIEYTGYMHVAFIFFYVKTNILSRLRWVF